MIQDMVDDELGLISASRSYVCDALPVDEPNREHLGNRLGGIRGAGHIDGEYLCVFCVRGPILWDQWRCMPYVLVPFYIRETP